MENDVSREARARAAPRNGAGPGAAARGVLAGHVRAPHVAAPHARRAVRGAGHLGGLADAGRRQGEPAAADRPAPAAVPAVARRADHALRAVGAAAGVVAATQDPSRVRHRARRRDVRGREGRLRELHHPDAGHAVGVLPRRGRRGPQPRGGRPRRPARQRDAAPGRGPGEAMMLVAAVAGLLVAMALTLVRAFLGPRLYNRGRALSVFGTKTVLLISVLGVIAGRPYIFDIALLYALVNFVSTIAVLRLTHLAELLPASDEGSPR